MKLVVKILFGLLVLLLLSVPVSAESSTITSISPAYGYTGSTVTVTITGTDFNVTEVTPKLMMTGKGNITSSTITSHDATTIVCKFVIPSDTSEGTWNVVVVNQDGSEAPPKVDAFKIRAPVTLSSISPTTGRTNNVSTKISVVGTGLSSISSMYLYASGVTNTTATGLSVISSTRVNGTLDLTSKNVDTYKICLVDSLGTHTCGLSFKITSDAVGSIDVESSPSGADLYLDGVLKGTTPITIDDLDIGSYKLIVKKDGYVDWMRTAKVTNGGTTSFTANLEVKTTAPTTATPLPTTAPTTVKTTRKSTIATPTPWPSDTPTTAASPVGILAIISTVGLSLIVLRKH